MVFDKETPLYYKAYGNRYIKITALFGDDVSANNYLLDNHGEGVVYSSTDGSIILIARNDDLGVPANELPDSIQEALNSGDGTYRP